MGLKDEQIRFYLRNQFAVSLRMRGIMSVLILDMESPVENFSMLAGTLDQFRGSFTFILEPHEKSRWRTEHPGAVPKLIISERVDPESSVTTVRALLFAWYPRVTGKKRYQTILQNEYKFVPGDPPNGHKTGTWISTMVDFQMIQ